MAISKIDNNSLNSGVPDYANLPAGSVLQVVNFSYSTQATTTSTSFTTTGLTATITPKFATSKIMVLVTQGGCQSGGSIYSSICLQLVRNSTVIVIGNSLGYSGNTLTTNQIGFVPMSYLDSPATTSATTYTTQFAQQVGGAGTVYVQNAGIVSVITLMEIAA